jgi:hypothetical protein
MTTSTERKPMLSYRVAALCYRGHIVKGQVVNRLHQPGEVYRQCGQSECQCAAPMVSTALVPADEETRLAVEEQKVRNEARRRPGGNASVRDEALLKARIAELEAQVRVSQLEAELAQRPPAAEPGAQKGRN